MWERSILQCSTPSLCDSVVLQKKKKKICKQKIYAKLNVSMFNVIREEGRGLGHTFPYETPLFMFHSP